MVTVNKTPKHSAKLLSTKIIIPSLQSNVVQRTRLVDRLITANKHDLTLLVAPAGYGKTTVLSQWAFSAPYPIAWLSLDSRDNDPVSFWGHFLSSLQTINPSIATRHFNLAQSLSNLGTEAVLEDLINNLTFELYDECVVALDDYHVIENKSIHDGINFLIKNSGQRLHIIIASRSEPPLDLTKIRVHDRLLDLRISDMRFTTEEIKIYFIENLKQQISSQDIEAIEKYTEGWAAGLYLAGFTLRSSDGFSGVMQTFENSHQLILDYLSDQVLKNQPEEIYAFLVKTSILGQLNSSLCNALTGEQNSDTILKKLEKENLFVLPIDGKHYWYRYHELFADLLRERLKEFNPSLTFELHRRASNWYADHGFMEEAIQHALKARAFERAIQLLHQVLDLLMVHGEVHRVLQWRLLIPEKFIDNNPELCLLIASAFLLTCQFSQVEAMLLKIEQANTVESVQMQDPKYISNSSYDESDLLEPTKEPAHRHPNSLIAWVQIFRAFMMRFRNSYESISISERALDLSPADEPRIRSRALLCVGHANLLVGDNASAEQALSEASALCIRNQQLPAYLSAIDFLAQLRIFQGRLREARVFYTEARRIINEATEPIYSGIELIGLGNLLRETNNLAEARRYIEKGIQLAEKGGDFVFIYDGYIVQSKLEQACGNTEAALAVLQKARGLLQIGQMKSALMPVEALNARFLLSQGKLMAVEQWSKDFTPRVSDKINFLNSTSFIVFIQILIAKGRFDDAIYLLARLRNEAEAAGWAGLLIELLALNAIALASNGNTKEAISLLQIALIQAEPENYMRVFIDFGEPIKELLIKMRSAFKTEKPNGISPQLFRYVNELLNAFGEKNDAGISSIPGLVNSNQTLNLKLTQRELEILSLVDEGFSNLDIANQLILSEGTVRRHMHNICRKLVARNRSEAVARARKIGLLLVKQNFLV